MYGSQSSFERSAVQLPVVAVVGGGLVTGAFGDGMDVSFVQCGRSNERGLWVECHTEEFCLKVLKFEIMNSRKSFNYFSEVVPRTIETVR